MNELLCADLWECLVPMRTCVTLRRFRPTPLQYGRRQGQVACEEREIEAVVQPLITRDNKNDSQGSRDEGRIVLWTDEVLLTQKTAKGVEADVVVYECVEYEVYESRDWRSTAGFVRSEAERVPF